MSMMEGKSGEMQASINVTPMIDVLLVLLIIFMVIVPAVPRGESALAPKSSLVKTSPDPDSVVLEILASGQQTSFKINRQEVSRENLSQRLSAIFANRAQRVLFVKGDDRLSFTQVADVIDISHAAGIDHVGLITPAVQMGH